MFECVIYFRCLVVGRSVTFHEESLDMVRYRIGKEKVRWVMVGKKSKNGKMVKLEKIKIKIFSKTTRYDG